MAADDDAARLAIFEKYEAGREGGVEVEDWEDPNLELYAVTDRYGFMHKERLPPSNPTQKDLDVMRHRAQKWSKMLVKWDSVLGTSVFRRRVFKGVPESVRLTVWSKFLDLKTIKKPGQYEAAYYAARERGKVKDIDQINKDIARRFREQILFRERYGQGQQILFRILAAYSMYNTEIGYCQGMDAIAGLLMMYMAEEDAYWAMCKLMSSEKYAMHGLYVEDLRKLHEMCNHHGTIRRKVLPKINKHLEKVGFDPTLYGTKWFMEGFQERLPFSLVLRIWDVYLYLGEQVMHAMAALLIKLFKKQMTKQSFEELHMFMKELPGHKFDNDEVMEQLDLMLQDLTKQKLSGFPKATSLTFLPTQAAPSYPVPPEEFRDLTLRREKRLAIKSLPPGMGLERESDSLASESSMSEGMASPERESATSAPTIIPLHRQEAAEARAAEPLTSPVSTNGASSLRDMPVAEEKEEEGASTPLAQHQTNGVEPLQLESSFSAALSSSVMPESAGRPTDLGTAVEEDMATTPTAYTAVEGEATPGDAATPKAAQGPMANGVIGHDKSQLDASGSDQSLRIRVSTI